MRRRRGAAVRFEQLRRERAELARSSRARRFEVVSLIYDRAPITAADAGNDDLPGRCRAG